MVSMVRAQVRNWHVGGRCRAVHTYPGSDFMIDGMAR